LFHLRIYGFVGSFAIAQTLLGSAAKHFMNNLKERTGKKSNTSKKYRKTVLISGFKCKEF